MQFAQAVRPPPSHPDQLKRNRRDLNQIQRRRNQRPRDPWLNADGRQFTTRCTAPTTELPNEPEHREALSVRICVHQWPIQKRTTPKLRNEPESRKRYPCPSVAKSHKNPSGTLKTRL